MYRSYIVMLLLLCTMNGAGQNFEDVFGDAPDSTYTEEVIGSTLTPLDTLLIKNDLFVSPDSIRRIKRKKEFAYLPLMDSLLKKETLQNDKKIKTSLSLAERFLNSNFFRFFLWLIPITLLLIVLYNFAQSRGTFKRKIKSAVILHNEDDVQNTVYDYLALSREAAHSGHYRPAVKYLFLRTLQLLSSAGMIEFSADKTNYNYVQEISVDKRRDFAKLVLNYEYVWYGNANPEKPMYETIENQFTTFFKKYNLS